MRSGARPAVANFILLHLLLPCDSNACAEDGLPMLSGSQAAAFYPTLCANDYVPDSYRLAGTVEAGLRKCRLVSLPAYLLHQLQSGDERLDPCLAGVIKMLCARIYQIKSNRFICSLIQPLGRLQGTFSYTSSCHRA